MVGQRTAENLSALPPDYRPPGSASDTPIYGLPQVDESGRPAAATGETSAVPFQPSPAAINAPEHSSDHASTGASGSWGNSSDFRTVNAPGAAFDPKRQTESYNASKSLSTAAYGSTKGKFLRAITARGKEQIPFGEPAHVAFWSGRLVVADTASRKLSVFSKEGRWSGDLYPTPGRQRFPNAGRLRIKTFRPSL